MQDDTFAACLKDDKSTKHWLAQLLKNLEAMPSQNSQGGLERKNIVKSELGTCWVKFSKRKLLAALNIY